METTGSGSPITDTITLIFIDTYFLTSYFWHRIFWHFHRPPTPVDPKVHFLKEIVYPAKVSPKLLKSHPHSDFSARWKAIWAIEFVQHRSSGTIRQKAQKTLIGAELEKTEKTDKTECGAAQEIRHCKASKQDQFWHKRTVDIPKLRRNEIKTVPLWGYPLKLRLTSPMTNSNQTCIRRPSCVTLWPCSLF